MTVKSSISLTDDQFAFAKSMVETGQYSSLSAVLQNGIEMLRQREADDILERKALRALIEQRVQDNGVSAKAFDKNLSTMIAKKRQALGLDS
ncbi:type II toxin-antitoxin system ParD family antitoxin [Cognatishimia sp. 1_MG-2023]|uniref:ribbon-helix-helix domain-containing protein n=1 Tax=Cognatishimia sp. 1_MG-2023 TaxID=3062642 RepID=UPI0026E44580|nr:type II toxin-antitoxin system ParD family antitoxin [Cognatishimia sp. 1_MG-2023]MDO6728263.1 type II toxin-antitoxin system ParD family antitoxin [Cognatishimia sp. 1_MG-2023]